MKGELCTAGGDDGEGEVGEDVEVRLTKAVFGGHTVFPVLDPCKGGWIKFIGRGVIVEMGAVDADPDNGSEVGTFSGESCTADEVAECPIFFVGEIGVGMLSHGGEKGCAAARGSAAGVYANGGSCQCE